ncbi:MAG TPA: pyridoxal phosphate-dependent aminotransferase [Burkholderiales bacterium]|nr:pyridoxal phosphate-dependent aminotransferase [Burkholderiales bacterium]
MFSPTARPAVQALRPSRIREVANAAMGRKDVLAFWFGEPDEVTPAFIREAAIASLDAGETFYSQNLGLPELREAIAAYLSGLHSRTSSDEIAVTSSGLSALQLATQALVGAGDRVVEVTPLWPNLVEIPKILGARVECVPLQFAPDGWRLDLDRLLSALTPDTRVLFVNSPNNPTGWTIDRDAQRALLAHCRHHGIWLIADDAYERLHYALDVPVAPSFLDLAEAGDRLLSTNTFSKSWSMTGWRLGWLRAPRELIAEMPKLIEYNTSCAPVFVQRAGVVAITQGEAVIGRTRERFRKARDFLVAQLREIPGIAVAAPAGAMYAFFKVDGARDSLALCKHLVSDAGLGLAPGVAFGEEGEGFVRWCFAASEERLSEGVSRLRRGLQSFRQLGAPRHA